MNTVVLKRGESVVAKAMPMAELTDGTQEASKIEAGSGTSTSSSSAVLADPVVENPDGSIEARFHWAGPGDAQVTFGGDADLGAGVTPITGIGQITCLPDQATTFDVSFGAVEQDAPATP